MATFSLTTKAKQYLRGIAAFTQRRWNREQRRIYMQSFDEAFHMLAENPNTGLHCDFIKAGYRKFPVTSHVIYYRERTNSEIEIVRVLHKRMDAQSKFVNP